MLGSLMVSRFMLLTTGEHIFEVELRFPDDSRLLFWGHFCGILILRVDVNRLCCSQLRSGGTRWDFSLVMRFGRASAPFKTS